MLTPHDRLLIAAKGIMCERTVRRVYAGGGSERSRLRVATVARELGLPEPALLKCSTSSLSSSPPSSKSA